MTDDEIRRLNELTLERDKLIQRQQTLRSELAFQTDLRAQSNRATSHRGGAGRDKDFFKSDRLARSLKREYQDICDSLTAIKPEYQELRRKWHAFYGVRQTKEGAQMFVEMAEKEWGRDAVQRIWQLVATLATVDCAHCGGADTTGEMVRIPDVGYMHQHCAALLQRKYEANATLHNQSENTPSEREPGPFNREWRNNAFRRRA